MAKKILFLVLPFLFSALADAESTTLSKCLPVTGAKWKGASVEYLQNATQVLYHVKAAGIYMAADLLCGTYDCVGFVNGEPATGHITLLPNTNVIESVRINDTSFPVTFQCQSL